MELKTAIEKAFQILNEEHSQPTVAYSLVADRSEALSNIETISKYSVAMNLDSLRAQRPRAINENPTWFQFQSVNYDLLRAIFSQVSEADRKQFLRSIRNRIILGARARQSNSRTFPQWLNIVSELPLVVEFLVRTDREELFAALESMTGSVVPGHVLMLMQIEDMIALNYTVVSDADYQRFSSAIDFVATSTKTYASKYALQPYPNGRARYQNVNYPGLNVTLDMLVREIFNACRGIREQCRKAQYFYLKGALLQGLNLEVNQDKTRVQEYISRFQLSPLLSGSLDEADRLYQERDTPFNLKSSIGHLRSFLENLQKEAIPRIHARCGGDLPASWGSGLAYLLKHDVLSKVEEQFASSFYTLISDEGVHPLIAEREYARLARNMVIEYALLFLSKLDKFHVSSAVA